ncbi:MAG TPA: hypothetical protein VE863_14255 [Pyrinomonadaceae bacterium]|nr:hypothetical protein [Pyrinomonadaceae bacterium]
MTKQPLKISIPIMLAAFMLGLSSMALSVRNNADTTTSQPLPQQLTDKGENSEWAQCESYCDPYKPGTSIAEIRWKVADQALGVAEIKDRTAQEVIEVSVYKDGFERGLYANITPTEGRHQFSLVGSQPAHKELPGLNRLVLVGMTTSGSPTNGFRMLADDPAGGGGQWAVAKVEGLEAGLLYFWRVQSKNANLSTSGPRVVSCQAATCPVDSMRRPVSRRRR